MRDPLSTDLLIGAHHFMISGLWVLLLATLGLFMLRSLTLAAQGGGRHHPLVWLVLGLCLWAVILMLCYVYQPDLVWGLLGLGVPVCGVVLPVLRPRPRRFRTGR